MCDCVGEKVCAWVVGCDNVCVCLSLFSLSLSLSLCVCVCVCVCVKETMCVLNVCDVHAQLYVLSVRVEVNPN